MPNIMKLSIPDYIADLTPYVPGKPVEEVEREYGIRRSVKLASNENPLGPSPKAVAAIGQALDRLNRYPDGGAYELVGRLAAKLGLERQNIILGNGSDEIIGMLTRAFLRPGDEALLHRPAFLMYEILARSCGAVIRHVPLRGMEIDLQAMAEAITPRTRLVFITNPNNPTGAIISAQAFERFWQRVPPHVVVVLDEAYIEFVRDRACAVGVDFFSEDRPLVALRTFSKAYGLAGLRIGYGIMPAALSDLLQRIRQPFNTNSLAQIGALAALEDIDFLKNTVQTVHGGMDYLQSRLADMGVRCFASQANFFLVDVGRDADRVFEDLMKQGVIVRSMTSYGFAKCIRVNVGRPEENDRLLEALQRVL